jgi:hypothetical protein
MRSSIHWKQLLVMSALTFFCLSGCAREYEGKTSYTNSNCKESIQLDDGSHPFYPVLIGKSLFPVFICFTFHDGLKYCSYAEVSDTGECKRVYSYSRKSGKKQ